MDAKAAADAIALRFVGATTSLGETFSTTPTASLPNAVAKGPVCLVFPPTGELDIGVSRRRMDVLEYTVRILLDPLDVPSRTDRLYRWFAATRDVIEADMDLGVPGVAWARLTSCRVELDGATYAGATFDVVEYGVSVRWDEVVTTVAI